MDHINVILRLKVGYMIPRSTLIILQQDVTTTSGQMLFEPSEALPQPNDPRNRVPLIIPKKLKKPMPISQKAPGYDYPVSGFPPASAKLPG